MMSNMKPILAFGIVALLLAGVFFSGCLKSPQLIDNVNSTNSGNNGTVLGEVPGAAAADATDLPVDDLNDSINALNDLK